MIEYITLDDDWSLQNHFNKGWELLTIYYIDGVQHESVSEPVQSFSISTGSSGYPPQSQQYVTKSIPLVIRKPRFILKRTPAAKTLYEKSLHENKSANT